MNQMLKDFPVSAGFQRVPEDEPEQVCTAEVFTCGEMRVIWMAWVPGFDNIGIQSSRRVQGGGRLQAWVVRFAVAH